MRAPARLANIELSLQGTGSVPEVSVDGTRIERAVANLLRNALEHTPSGGRVEVSVAAADGHVELRVADTGDGIEPEDLRHIWDRFYRAEKSRRRAPGNGDGAGLGLAIVRGIVEAHGGTVEAHSSPGRGTTFNIRLPLN
jgi:signal transduction histidine kinase